LTDRAILLNGKILELDPDDRLPDFDPLVTDATARITVPAYGMAFWTVRVPEIEPLCRLE
jgi:hypothetical protein